MGLTTTTRILTTFLALLSCCGQTALGVDDPAMNSTHFCYDKPECGPKKWGKLPKSELCTAGRAQSPINIDTLHVKPNFKGYSPFRLNSQYGRRVRRDFYGQNNGHTAQFEFVANSSGSALTSKLEMSGDHLGPSRYTFAQLHFHWALRDDKGSEHTVNEHRFPLELHLVDLVHHKTDYDSQGDALDHDDPAALAVIAVFFEVGPYNRHLEPIITALDRLKRPTPGKDKAKHFRFLIRISDLIPYGKDYARYQGSLTTPPCSEKVVWTVFLDPQTLSEEQMDKFRMLRDEEGVSSRNFRPLQPLNGRKVAIYRNLEN